MQYRERPVSARADLFESFEPMFEWNCNKGLGSITGFVEAFQRGRCFKCLMQMCVFVCTSRRRKIRMLVCLARKYMQH